MSVVDFGQAESEQYATGASKLQNITMYCLMKIHRWMRSLIFLWT